MPNKTYAIEWLESSRHNLETAVFLFKHRHYKDVIAIDIHQSVEKAFKSIYAYYGHIIPRTHFLPQLFEFAKSKIIRIEESPDDILEISEYYKSDRYPVPRYTLPSDSEINKNLMIAKRLYDIIEQHITID